MTGGWIPDRFVLAMLAAVLVATVLPDLGRSGGWLRADAITDYGIFAVFFLHGVGLSTDQLRSGLARWRLHLLVQSFTFGVFPLLGWLADQALGSALPADLRLGFLYLCALPSTISSSVAMTSLARGNVPAAVFNATLSTLLGIGLTPLLVGLAIGHSQQLSLPDAMGNIARLLLLPFVAGQLLRPLVGERLARFRAQTQLLDRAVIVLLVLAAFSDSVADGLWRKHGPLMLLQTLIGAGLLLAAVLQLTRWAARKLGFNAEDEITAVFCGSKKTLASGVPMARLLFGSQPEVGVVILPILFYHQLQLFVCALLARRYASRPSLQAPSTAA